MESLTEDDVPDTLLEPLKRRVKSKEIKTMDDLEEAMIEIINRQCELANKIMSDDFRAEKFRDELFDIYKSEVGA